jgi:uncharacterized protein YfaS (alpha-2-macroglobulin family)
MDASRLRYLHDERLDKIENPLAKAYLGAALYNIGDRSRSKSAFDQSVGKIGYKNSGDYYQTVRRDRAGVLALAAEANQEEAVEALTELVVNDLPEPQAMTTQEKAYLLLAADALTDGETKLNVRAEGRMMRVNDGRMYFVNEESFRPAEDEKFVAPTFTNRGDAPVWFTSMAQGTPSEAPRPDANGLSITKNVFALSGQTVDLSQMARGDQAIIAIRATPRDRREHPVMIADLLPAGWEIQAVLTPDTAGAYSFLGNLDYADVSEARDDRFLVSTTLREGESADFAYVIRAVTPGEFAMPGVVVEDMYRPEVFARSIAQRVSIAEGS